ncbi:MAG: GTPase [Isosphaeraceae bacterium]
MSLAFLAILTPQGRGAVAVVRVWGPDALAVADAAFRPNQGARLAKTPANRPRVGRMGAGLGDEVVAVVLGFEPFEVEIQCHGGPVPLALVVEALTDAGAKVVEPGRWVESASPSPIAAQARVDLAEAPTVRAAEILMDQMQGALDADLHRAAALAANNPIGAIELLDELVRRSKVGCHLIKGWRVVLAGRPNVGKSRLLNALAGFDRAIVTATPGTTRDVVTVRTAFDGWPVELADTAGLRTTADDVETAGIALARARQAEADLVLLILDGSEPLTSFDLALIDTHPEALHVVNKADLPRAWEPDPASALIVSAERGDGLDLLVAAIAGRLVPGPPPAGSGVPFRHEHVIYINKFQTKLIENW